MAKQSKKATKTSSSSSKKKEASKKTDKTEKKSAPLTVEELSAIVKRDHDRIEEMHKYMKHLRWLSGARLLITVVLVVVPTIIAIVALPPLLRQAGTALQQSGVINEQGVFDPGAIFEQVIGDQMQVLPGGAPGEYGEYPGNLQQPPADFDTWTREEQEEWVRQQFDG